MKRNILFLLCLIGWCAQAQEQTNEPQEQTLSADSLITQDGRLDSLYRSLPEVMIVGERPVVKAEPGKLVYDLPRLVKDLPVDNALDAVKQLPGVAEMNGSLQLAGQGVTVILDGKVSTLSAEQLQSLLRSIPVSRIENAEVMYTAPARYQVRGALINITLKRAAGEHILQGELFSKYYNKGQDNLSERATLLYRRGKLSMDFLYSYNHYSRYHTTPRSEAVHTLKDGSVYELKELTDNRAQGNTHNFRLGADYDFAKSHQLSLVYTGAVGNSDNKKVLSGTQTGSTTTRDESQLHNLRMDYRTPVGLSAGAEMTYYHSPRNQLVRSEMNGAELDFYTHESQRINNWKLFLAGEHPLKSGWGINYGIVYITGVDNSGQHYFDADSREPLHSGQLADLQSRRREETMNLYAGFTRRFNDKFSMDASLAVEHYRTPAWDEWDLYPSLNLSYMPSPLHILQLSLSSSKSYPAYWELRDAVSYMGVYKELHGNPLLKPVKSYGLQLVYVLQSKYVFAAWYNHNDDYSVQTLYQSPDRLAEIYKTVNFDYRRQAGLQIAAPFKVGRWLNSRLTLIGSWTNEKDSDFWDIPFNRYNFMVMAMLNNTIDLSSKPDLKLTLNGMIRSLSTQGTYDLPASGNLSASLRYTFANQRAVLQLYGEDLLETNGINPRINFKGQNVINHYSYFRELGVSFTYKFGGYKEKKRAGVDTSRFK